MNSRERMMEDLEQDIREHHRDGDPGQHRARHVA